MMMEEFGLKGARRAAGRGAAEGQETKHKTPQLCSAWTHPTCQALHPVHCCPLPWFVLSGHRHQSQPGCPGRAWTTLHSLAIPLPSNGQSPESICWLLGRKMLGFLPPTPPQPPALIISGSKGSLWHKHRDTHSLLLP